jgi:hypothetical protein
VQAINGSILVKVQNGYELDELHDVFVGGVSTALPLVYSSTSSGWVAQALTSVGIADNAVVAEKINAAAVNTAKIDSTGGSSGWLLTANGSGGASFAVPAIAAIQFNTQTAAYTLALTDKDKIVQANSTAAFNITIPPNSSVAFTTGSQVHILQVGSGQTTIAAGTGVTANATPGLKCRAQWSAVTLVKRDTNTWVAFGDLSA